MIHQERVFALSCKYEAIINTKGTLKAFNNIQGSVSPRELSIIQFFLPIQLNITRCYMLTIKEILRYC